MTKGELRKLRKAVGKRIMPDERPDEQRERGGASEWTESRRGYIARERWARRYCRRKCDELAEALREAKINAANELEATKIEAERTIAGLHDTIAEERAMNRRNPQ